MYATAAAQETSEMRRRIKTLTPTQMAWEARLHTDDPLIQELMIACSAEWSEGFSEDSREKTFRELKTTPTGRALLHIIENILEKFLDERDQE